MNANQWERCCFWRAVEGAEAMGLVLSETAEAETTTASRGDLTSQGINPEALSGDVEAFLVRRVERLDDLATGNGGRAELLEAVRLPSVPRWITGLGWLGAVVAGFAMTTLGNERELNLLALPLVGLLLWNAVVMAGAVVMEFLPTRPAGRRGFWFDRRRKKPVENKDAARVAEAYESLTGDLGRRFMARQFRSWLHVGAALVAAGSMLALFARGWSVEYRAVWESTILNEAGAEKFLGGMFTPAAKVFGPAVPLEEVAGMRRGAGLQTRAADALPWLKLYAGTLALGVVLPRLVLALLTWLRGRGDLRRTLMRQGWPGYALRLLRRVEGSGSSVLVLVAGSSPEERARERWRNWLGMLYGGRCDFNMQAVEEANQDEWVAAWTPEDGRVVVIFFLAATPEEEVQRELLSRLRKTLVAAHYEPELAVLLDAEGLASRWAASKRESREQLWREAVSGLATTAWIGDEGGLTDLCGDTPQKPL